MKLFSWLRGKKTAIGAAVNLLVQLANSQWPEYQEVWMKLFEVSNWFLAIGLADKGIKAIPDKYVPIKALRTGVPIVEPDVSEPQPYPKKEG